MKYEIKIQDGPGRLNKIIFDKKIVESPSLVNLYDIPSYHKLKEKNKIELNNCDQDKIVLGYLPALHQFSRFDTTEDVIQIIKTEFVPKFDGLDFIVFPLDRAEEYRADSHYMTFINDVSESIPDTNFGIILPKNDNLNNWKNIKSVDLIVLGEISNLINNQRKLYKYLKKINLEFVNLLKYAPNIPPSFFPLLAYLGIDLFDDLYANFAAYNNLFLDWDTQYEISDMDSFQPPCNCPACKNIKTSSSKIDWLLGHNYYLSDQIILKIRLAIKSGTLRDLVKQFVLSDPIATGILRIADLDDSNNILKTRTPSLRKDKLLLTSSSDYTRPEVAMFHERINNRYLVPKWADGIVLLPCSAKKPYSESRSHRLFGSAIKRALKSKKFNLLELIVTSPLGIVPRHLELTYPAGFYDIPVTGNWSDLETNTVFSLLDSIFENIEPEFPIISYLADPEKSIVKSYVKSKNFNKIKIIDLNESETSPNSLKTLTETLIEYREKFRVPVQKNMHELEYFRAMANYQFGLPAGEILFPEETVIKLRSYRLIALLSNKQLATLQHGYLALTAFAAQRLADHFEGYKVHFADTSINGSAVYTPGIIKADPKIKPNDTVLVISDVNKKLIGIGTSFLAGIDLESSNYGIGVSLKKKTKQV